MQIHHTLLVCFALVAKPTPCFAGNWISRITAEEARNARDQAHNLGRPEGLEVIPPRRRNQIESRHGDRKDISTAPTPIRSEFPNVGTRHPLIMQKGRHTLPLTENSRRRKEEVLRDHIHEKSKGIQNALYDKRFVVDALDNVSSGKWFNTPKGKVSLRVLLGQGTYGKVYSGKLCDSNGSCRVVAVKFQKPIMRPFKLPFGLPDHYAEIEHEYAMMKIMRGVEGFAPPHTANFAGTWKYYVTDLLGQDIHTISESYNFRVPFKVAIHLTRQMLLRIRQLHEKGYVAQDIHSGNFVLDHSGTVYMIDLAFAFPWKQEDGSHIPDGVSHFPTQRDRKSPVATRREDKGLETSRADDLERLLYLVLEMFNGELPWAKVKDLGEFKRLKSTLTDSPQNLCKRMNVPWLSPVFEAVFVLGFQDEPPYSGIDKFLLKLSRRKDLASFRR